MEKQKFLIVVDMQNDFIDGSLGTKEAQAIVPAAAARVRACRDAGYAVIATLDTHEENYPETREGKFLPVPHCIRGTEGWRVRREVMDALGPHPFLLEKPTFGSVRLPEIVREWSGPEGPAVIELIGLCTDICVVSNAMLLKAAFPEADLAVCADCCAGVTPEKHGAALETMRSCQIRVTASKEEEPVAKEYHFDAAAARDRLVGQIRSLADAQGFSRVVIGISGGKDSTVTAALCARALGPENVFGVMMPDGEQKDISDSRQVCAALRINHRTVNIGAMHSILRDVTDQNGSAAQDGEFSVPYSRENDINVGPRLRMTTLRYIGQALGARLAGTGNLSELTVGYCTKDGDTSCDFSVLGALTSVEVVQLGLTMEELPRELVVKTPADGLSGKSDEERLGLTYQDIHLYIRLGTCGNPETDEKIRRKESANMHKRRMPLVLNPLKEDE